MLATIFRQHGIPQKYRSNFLHLYLDIAWFGVLSGSAVNFITVYATRLGASGFQIGLLGAVSAVVNLTIAIPAAHWLGQRHTGRVVFGSSVYYRLGYLIWIFLPSLFKAPQQIWLYIFMTFLMAIPLTPLSVGFNALFASAVPSEYRAHVAGIRNVALAITYMLTSLLSGFLLDHIPFPLGYQIVFGIGFLGAAMSSLHLYFIKPLQEETISLPSASEPLSQKRIFSPRNFVSSMRLDIWKTPYSKVLLGLLAFHLAQYLATPIFPLYNVRVLNLNDNNIGTGTAIFYLTMLIGSTQLSRLVHKIGHKGATAWGVMGIAIYPLMLAFSHQVWHFYLVSFIGGFVYAVINGAYANYMIDNIPANDRPPYLAWYNMILNAAILIGSLVGPAIAAQIGLVYALLLFALLRFLAGAAIMKWG